MRLFIWSFMTVVRFQLIFMIWAWKKNKKNLTFASFWGVFFFLFECIYWWNHSKNTNKKFHDKSILFKYNLNSAKNSNKLKCSSKDKFTTANWSHKVCSGCFIFKTIILCRSKLFQKISPTKQIIRFNCRWWENS